MKKLFLIGMASLLVLAALLGCESKEQKAAKAEEKAGAELLDAMLKNNAAKLEQALDGLAPEILADRLTAGKSATPGGDFAYKLNETGDGIVITGYTGNGGVLVIPATIEDYPVVELPRGKIVGGYYQSIFEENYAITSVVVPPGVKRIPSGAFAKCENLNSVILPDTVEEIDDAAFRGCISLHTVNLPAELKQIYFSAFTRCGELYNVIIPDSLTAISWPGNLKNEFSGCGKLPLKTRQRLKDLGYQGEF